MKSVPVTEAKNNLSALLREVRGGSTILITDRGIPVAQLSSPASTDGISASAVDLAQRGRLVLPQREPSGAWLSLPAARPTGGASAVAALLAERRESP